MRVWPRVAASCGSLALITISCGGSSGSKSPELDDPLASMYSAMERRCSALQTCYPQLNAENDGVCWGPTGKGKHGWSLTTASDRTAQRRCFENVFARLPEATDAYLRCFALVYDDDKACIDDLQCAQDITACVDMSKEQEAHCQAVAGGAFEEALAEECNIKPR